MVGGLKFDQSEILFYFILFHEVPMQVVSAESRQLISEGPSADPPRASVPSLRDSLIELSKGADACLGHENKRASEPALVFMHTYVLHFPEWSRKRGRMESGWPIYLGQRLA